LRVDNTAADHPFSLRDYLAVVARRKWIILQSAAIVPVVAVLFSLTQPEVFSASAQVLLNRQNLATGLTNTPDASLFIQADRVAQTQVDLARVATIAARVLKEVPAHGMTVNKFLANSSVSSLSNSDILQFRVKAATPTLSKQLVLSYARQYTIYRRELDTAAVERARISVQKHIATLKATNIAGGALYNSLIARADQLQTMEALQTSNALVVQAPTGSAQIQPKPARNGVLGAFLGLALGLGLAFLIEALDSRLRSAEQIRERLGMPLLCRLPRPERTLRSKNQLAMIAASGGTDAEAFRMLRTQLELARLESGAKTVMVTSAVPGEGKSTTISNLALASARGGTRVVLVDLDLYNPAIARFFWLEGPGLTDVALGRCSLDDALIPFPIFGSSDAKGQANGNGAGAIERPGFLEILPCGPTPPEPGDFVNTRVLQEILHELRSRADLVLIDASPLLLTDAALTLSTKVDGVLVVSRLNIARRRMLADLSQVLHRTPAAKLGVVVTDDSEMTGYGLYGQTYGYPTLREDERERVSR